MDYRTGSIALGKTAEIILVDGDIPVNFGRLRRADTVFLDSYRVKGDALHQAIGLSGMPK